MRFGDFTISMDQADKERLDKLVDRMAYVEGMGSTTGGMAAYQQLGELKAAGVLTDAEFDAKKKELLAKL